MTRTAWAWGLSAIFGLCGVSAAADSYQRGVTAYFARDYAGAEAALEESVTSSADPRAWYFKGLAERAQDKHAEAQASIHQGAALLAAGHGDTTTVRRSLERVQGSTRAYLESVQSFYAKTHETPANVIASGPSAAEEFSQFVSTLGTDADGKLQQVAAPATDAVPVVIDSAPAYVIPAKTCFSGGSCSSFVSATATIDSTTTTAPVISSGCGSTVSYGYDGGCGGSTGCGAYSGGGWGGCRTRTFCGPWRSRVVTRCSSGGWGGGCGSWGGGGGCGSYDSGSIGCGSDTVGCGGYSDGCGDSGGGYRGCGLGFGFRSRGCW